MKSKSENAEFDLFLTHFLLFCLVQLYGMLIMILWYAMSALLILARPGI